MWSFVEGVIRYMSSAYLSRKLVLWSGLRSAPFKAKRGGPTTDPWNTLELIGRGLEVMPTNLVVWE